MERILQIVDFDGIFGALTIQGQRVVVNKLDVVWLEARGVHNPRFTRRDPSTSHAGAEKSRDKPQSLSPIRISIIATITTHFGILLQDHTSGR